MSSTSNELLEHRARASELSGGTSSNAIYSKIVQLILDRALNGRILDYGAGVGQLTRRLLTLGRFHSVAAVDMMGCPADLRDAVEWIEQDLNVPIRNHDGLYDVVVAAEVIEHLENPRSMMRELCRLLRPGGTVIVTTPNNESWRSLIALLFRGHYVAFSDSCYPAHITPLLRKDFTRIFQEAKLCAPEFLFTDEGGIPGSPAMKWQQISSGLLRGLRFSDNIMAVAEKPK